MAARIFNGVVGSISTDLRSRSRMRVDLQLHGGVVVAGIVERKQGLRNVECLCVVVVDYDVFFLWFFYYILYY